MKKQILLTFIIITFAGCAASKYPPSQPYSWGKIHNSMTKNSLPGLAKKLGNDPEAISLIEKTVSSLNALDTIWSDEYTFDRDYLMGLTLESYLLQKALDSLSNNEAKAILREVATDAEIKLNHCRMHPNRMGSRVSLKVKTISASGDSVGWQVFHVLVGNFRFLNTPGQPLQKFSSPAEGNVSVGNNLIWAMKGEKKTKEQVFPIGFGKDDQEIEIPVP